MAWNEPGGPNKGQDPWGGGGRGGNQGDGPPDLDEAIRKLQSKLSGLFGGKGGGNAGGDDPVGGGGGGLIGSLGIGTIVLIAVVVWALSGIYIVNDGQRGVVLTFGAYSDTKTPGPNWHARFIQSVEIVNVEQIRTAEIGTRLDEKLMLTQDENIVDVHFVVQYRVSDPRAYLFNVRSPDQTLREATESAVREIVGKSTLDFVITVGRVEVAQQARELIQTILDNYDAGLVVTSINMQDAQPPEQVQDAFADAVRAREDEERLKNEAEAYANDIVPRARGAAARLLEEAEAYRARVIAEAEGRAQRFSLLLAEYRQSPEVTRDRLFIEALEDIFSSTTTVMVDVRESNSMLYLPIDRMVPQDGRATSQAPRTSLPGNSPESAPARASDRLRSREVR